MGGPAVAMTARAVSRAPSPAVSLGPAAAERRLARLRDLDGGCGHDASGMADPAGGQHAR